VALLQPVAQHRAVLLGEDVMSDFHHQIGPDTENVAVKGGVVDFAQRQSIRHDWLAEGILVADDVRCVEQVALAQPADGTVVR
jgi:hypothetical protein